ncbi:helix-turn-helix domain-containing protein, partial [Pseudomonas aeruginosa]|nr:helix-turn-helix domain-containing protein [Pseudomonas aeruginosa]
LDWIDREGRSVKVLRGKLELLMQDAIIDSERWGEIINQLVVCATQQLAPELSMGAVIRPGHIGVAAYLAMASENFAQALNCLTGFEHLVWGGGVEVRVDGCGIKFIVGCGDKFCSKHSEAIVLSSIVTFISKFLSSNIKPVDVSLSRNKWRDNDRVRAYEGFFKCSVVYGADRACVEYPIECLSVKFAGYDHALFDLLLDYARLETYLGSACTECKFEVQLRGVILRFISNGKVSISRVAEELNVSVRTLQRRLESIGVTWKQLVDDVKFRRARKLMVDSDMKLCEVAKCLGFADVSSFSRAFKRWASSSPGEYVRSCRGM